MLLKLCAQADVDDDLGPVDRGAMTLGRMDTGPGPVSIVSALASPAQSPQAHAADGGWSLLSLNVPISIGPQGPDIRWFLCGLPNFSGAALRFPRLQPSEF